MLTKKSKYAIKALVALAKHKPEAPYMRIAEISEKENIPKKFLESILLSLRNNGILGSKLGVNGGPIALIPCASLNFYQKCDDCEDEVTCGLRKVMTEVRVASLEVLSNNSIADIIEKEKRLVRSKRKK